MDYLKMIKSVLAAVGGVLVYWLGGLDQLLTALMAMIVLDYVTGVAKSWHTRSISSSVGFRGITKKVMLLGIVALAFIVQQLMSELIPLREITIMFFIANEGISIMENATAMGLPLPAKLKSVLAQLSDREA